jgi:hypothetical protein
MIRPVALIAAAALLAAAPAAGAQTAAAPSGSASPAQRPPNWKKVFGNDQYDVYIDQHSARNVPAPPEHPTAIELTAVLQYSIPEVINNYQVSSTEYHVDFDCSHPALFAVDMTHYASDMGTGAAVVVGSADNAWHAPQAGTLDQALWDAACGAKPAKTP